MADEESGFAPEPGPGLFPELEPDQAAPQGDLPWPPWLENLGTIGRVRAIVAAVADCAREHMHSPAVGEPCTAGQLQHCTATMATAFLLKLITEEDEPPQTLAEASEAMLPTPDETPPGRLAHVEVKGFRDLGVVRVSESTLGGVAMLRAVDADGAVAEFPASSLHFITWLPEGVELAAEPRRALTPGSHHDVHDGYRDRGDWAGDGPW